MRTKLHEMTEQQREELLALLKARYSDFCSMGLQLDMSRGKPCAEQLCLSDDVLCAIKSGADCFSENGDDCRNYGVSFGLPEMARIFAELLQVPQQQVIVGGVSSLNLMYDFVARAMSHGLANSEKPWSAYDKVRFITPVPGYDRHCTICEHFGIEMIPVPLTGNGPDMDVVEKLVAEDESIRGIWCNPVYSNYTGECYSNETLHRLAKMPAKAKDFTVLFDNAYCVHDLYGVPADIISFYDACCEAGNAERPILFASTSKITFAGGGVSCIAMGPKNLALAKAAMSVQFLSHDKLNQLRHARVLRDLKTVRERMQRHADILRPKFETVDRVLTEELGGYDAAEWSKPMGGYFICFKLKHGGAKAVVAMCEKAGVKLTGAGAGFPHSYDPDDCYIRIAPTYPPCEELQTAAQLLCVCSLITALECLA